MTTITISRQMGSLGSQIAHASQMRWDIDWCGEM